MRSQALEVYFSSGIVAHNGYRRVDLDEVAISPRKLSAKSASGHICTIESKNAKDIRVHCTCQQFQFRLLPAINEAHRQHKTPPIEGCKHIVALAARHLPPL